MSNQATKQVAGKQVAGTEKPMSPSARAGKKGQKIGLVVAAALSLVGALVLVATQGFIGAYWSSLLMVALFLIVPLAGWIIGAIVGACMKG